MSESFMSLVPWIGATKNIHGYPKFYIDKFKTVTVDDGPLFGKALVVDLDCEEIEAFILLALKEKCVIRLGFYSEFALPEITSYL